MVQRVLSVERFIPSIRQRRSSGVPQGMGRQGTSTQIPGTCDGQTKREVLNLVDKSHDAKRVPVVWLVNEGGHDYRDAERFGRLMPMTTGSINPFSPDRLMIVMSPRLKMAIQEDYLVISGSPILNALAVAMWLRRFDKLNALLWSHRDTEYKHVTISADSVERLSTDQLKKEA